MKKSSTLPYTLSSEGNKNVVQTIWDVYTLRGFFWISGYALLSLASYIFAPFWNIWYSIQFHTHSLSNRSFLFGKRKYLYFRHIYNRTWRCERIIEIPLIKSFLDKSKGKKVLEVGNVYSHYYKSYHDIVDNYEIAKNVINEDIMQFKPDKKYDIVFSISTIEHIGIDGVKETGKAVKAIQKMQKLLKKNGCVLFTVPLGYNKELDSAIWTQKLSLHEKYFFKRVSLDNKWKEVTQIECKRALYGFPFRWGNVILLGVIRNTK